MSKPNCYGCKYRGTVPGSAHSRCNVMKDNCTDETQIFTLEMGLAVGKFQLTNKQTGEPLVGIDEYGFQSGWASWPIDFDPVWIKSCSFETSKEVINETI